MRIIWASGVVGLLCCCSAVAEVPTPGRSWNESRTWTDALSGLTVRQLTTNGIYHQGPTVHPRTAFPGGGHEVVFAGFREGGSMLMSGDLDSGEIRMHYRIPVQRPDPDERREFFRNVAFQGLGIAASPHHRKVVASLPEALLLIDLDTRAAHSLLPADRRKQWEVDAPVFSATGASVVFPEFAVALREHLREREQRPVYYQHLELATGEMRTLYFHAWGQGHIIPHPSRRNLWLVKCGRPEFHLKGKTRDSASRISDVFLLNSDTGEVRALLPRNAYRRIAHFSWNSDGTRIVYHGHAAGGGEFVGVMNAAAGTVIWEHVFSEWNFERNGSNHIVADTQGDFLFDDGLAVPGQLSLLDYRQSGSAGAPAIHPVARWSNDWRGLPFQLSHPHPAVAPDGRFLVFYGCKAGRTQVYAVDLTPLRRKLAPQ